MRIVGTVDDESDLARDTARHVLHHHVHTRTMTQHRCAQSIRRRFARFGERLGGALPQLVVRLILRAAGGRLRIGHGFDAYDWLGQEGDGARRHLAGYERGLLIRCWQEADGRGDLGLSLAQGSRCRCLELQYDLLVALGRGSDDRAGWNGDVAGRGSPAAENDLAYLAPGANAFDAK